MLLERRAEHNVLEGEKDSGGERNAEGHGGICELGSYPLICKASYPFCSNLPTFTFTSPQEFTSKVVSDDSANRMIHGF